MRNVTFPLIIVVVLVFLCFFHCTDWKQDQQGDDLPTPMPPEVQKVVIAACILYLDGAIQNMATSIEHIQKTKGVTIDKDGEPLTTEEAIKLLTIAIAQRALIRETLTNAYSMEESTNVEQQ